MVMGFDPEEKCCENTNGSHSMEVPMQISHISNSCEIHVDMRMKNAFLPGTKSELDPGGIDYGDQNSIQEFLPNGYGFDTLCGDYDQVSIQHIINSGQFCLLHQISPMKYTRLDQNSLGGRIQRRMSFSLQQNLNLIQEVLTMEI